MAQVVSTATARRRFQLTVLILFAGAATVTAAVGIYGIVSHSLARRTNEIGVRMALGARRGDVHRLVLREGMTPVAVGLLVGVGAAAGLARGFRSLLFEVRPTDPVTLVSAAALLGLVAAAACWAPARRATARSAAETLRLE
jgi:ABC-type antimicrobial peptide transport system permease subunit